MSESRVDQVIEVKLEAESPATREELEQWLSSHGIHELIEASCDSLDIDEDEIEEYIAAYESGALNLPLLLYSYDRAWVDRLKDALRKKFELRIRWTERAIADELWQEAWQPGFRFLETEHFWVGPKAFVPEQTDKKVISLESGNVFGSGQHASTQALLSLLEKSPGEGVQSSFLDVGTGTGVLCFAAHHLGYSSIVGTDIEPEALAVAERNQGLNSIRFRLVEGSLPQDTLLFDMIVCNILPPTLSHLLADLVERLRPGGSLLLAGLNQVTEGDVLQSLASLHVRAGTRLLVRGWVARSFQKIL